MDGRSIPFTGAVALRTKPPVESFLDPDYATLFWPSSISQRPDFQAQTRSARTLLDSVEEVFKALPPGVDLARGLNDGLVTEAAVTSLLEKLTRYLKSDKAYERIIFYLPFELTSPMRSGSLTLTLASEQFQSAYRAAWESQSKQHDVRANFVDGDVLEVEKRDKDLKRVVKATHLIPGLVESRHLTFSEVVDYAERSRHELFKQGVVEACSVMLDCNLITRNDLEQLRASSDPYLTQSYGELLAQERPIEMPKQAAPLANIEAALAADIARAQQLEDNTATPNRLRWLQEQALERAVMTAAKQLCYSLSEGHKLPNPNTIYGFAPQAYVEALRLLLLQKKKLDRTHRDWLSDIAADTSCNNDTKARIVKLFRHAYTTTIVNDEAAREAGVIIPALAGPFSKNLEHFIPSVSECEKMIAGIACDEYLSSRVYRVAILFGSQLKGYGTENSDADVAVFIKPETDPDDCPNIARGLREIFDHERIHGSAIMFWLDRQGDKLVVRENTETTGMPPLNTWTHVLMGGAWIGNETCITTLQHDLLVPYLSNPTATLDGKPLRERWLEEMERDSILYRLLHKGFERYYPIRSPFTTVNGSAIDGASVFYDGTFRRIATKLFLTRVFFPNLDL